MATVTMVAVAAARRGLAVPVPVVALEQAMAAAQAMEGLALVALVVEGWGSVVTGWATARAVVAKGEGRVAAKGSTPWRRFSPHCARPPWQ